VIVDAEYVGKIQYTIDDLDLSTIEPKVDSEGFLVYQVPLTFNIRVCEEDGLLDFKILHENRECGKAKLAFSYSIGLTGALQRGTEGQSDGL
jgi:hypothetical protein